MVPPLAAIFLLHFIIWKWVRSRRIKGQWWRGIQHTQPHATQKRSQWAVQHLLFTFGEEEYPSVLICTQKERYQSALISSGAPRNYCNANTLKNNCKRERIILSLKHRTGYQELYCTIRHFNLLPLNSPPPSENGENNFLLLRFIDVAKLSAPAVDFL